MEKKDFVKNCLDFIFESFIYHQSTDSIQVDSTIWIILVI